MCKRRNNSRGMTLVEVLVGIVLIGIIAITVLPIIPMAFTQIINSGERSLAVNAGQSSIEDSLENSNGGTISEVTIVFEDASGNVILTTGEIPGAVVSSIQPYAETGTVAIQAFRPTKN